MYVLRIVLFLLSVFHQFSEQYLVSFVWFQLHSYLIQQINHCFFFCFDGEIPTIKISLNIDFIPRGMFNN